MTRFLFLGGIFLTCIAIDGGTSLWGRQGSNLATGYIETIHPGDIIRVVIKEDTKAKHNFKSEISDESTLTSDVMAKLRDLLALANIHPLNKLTNRLANTVATQKQTSEVDGEGKITADSTLESFITVMVKKVLPNGNLFVEGHKTVAINQETQIIRLKGVIRPQDVINNSVPSNLVANAEISFKGRGAFDGIRKPGALQKLFHVLF
jgi:flagellar L-ring protein FlgH